MIASRGFSMQASSIGRPWTVSLEVEYCDNAFEQITEIDWQKLRFADKEKIIGLCRVSGLHRKSYAGSL
jgi:hypothetical protein